MTRPIDTAGALAMLRSRGVDNAESLLEFADPDMIARTCRWWDAQTGVGTGLLVKRIREGGVQVEPPTSAGAGPRERFAEYAAQFPEGSVAESHARMEARQRPDNPNVCGGDLIVTVVSYPVIEVRCDRCAEEYAYPLRGLAVLPMAPADVGRPEPAQAKPNPEAPVTPASEDLPRHPPIPAIEGVGSKWLDQWAAKKVEDAPK